MDAPPSALPSTPPRKRHVPRWLSLTVLIYPLVLLATDTHLNVGLLDLPGLFIVGFLALHFVIGVHEAGHWLAGRLMGIHTSRFLVGSGRCMLHLRRPTFELLWSVYPTHGYVMPHPSQHLVSFPRATIYYLGGIGAELLVAAVCWILLQDNLLWHWVWANAPARYVLFVLILQLALTVYSSSYPAWDEIGGFSQPNDALQIVLHWKTRGERRDRAQFYADVARYNQIASQGLSAATEAAFDDLAGKYSNEPDLRLLASGLLAAKGRFTEARSIIDDLLKPDSLAAADRAHYIDHLITLFLNYGIAEWANEIDRWSYDALLASPNSVTLRGTRGSVLAELGRNAEARALLAEVLADTDSTIDRVFCHTYLAWLDAQEGKPDSARKHLKTAKSFAQPFPAIERIEKKIVALGK